MTALCGTQAVPVLLANVYYMCNIIKPSVFYLLLHYTCIRITAASLLHPVRLAKDARLPLH